MFHPYMEFAAWVSYDTLMVFSQASVFVTKGIRHVLDAGEDLVSLNFLVPVKVVPAFFSRFREKLLLTIISEEGLLICSSLHVIFFTLPML